MLESIPARPDSLAAQAGSASLVGSSVDAVTTGWPRNLATPEARFNQIVGSSPALECVLAEVKRVAPTDSTALVLGETGTGKELIAHAIHNLSARRGRPFIK